MENASKALIIAGAILISILLISVGILIMNSTGDITGQVGNQAQGMAYQTFNSQFDSYSGTRSTSQVQALIRAINTSNINNANKVGYYIYEKSTTATGTAGTKSATATVTAADSTKGIENASNYTVQVLDLGECTELGTADAKKGTPCKYTDKTAPDGYVDTILIVKK